MIRVGTAPVPSSTTYTSLLYAAVERAGATVDDVTIRKLLCRRYEIVHLHWPEWYLYRRPLPRMVARSAMVLAALAWARHRGARVVWTAHNAFPHERVGRRFGKSFFWIFTGLVDAVVSPSESGVEPLRSRFPRLARTSMSVIPLGHLRGRYSDHGSRALARKRFGINADAEVATFFGHVRPYKNVDGLVREFRRVADPDAVLLIGGRPLDEAVRADVEQAAGDDDRIRLHLGYVKDDDVQHFMRAADIVVLPYAESSNSFVALLALSFDRPILAPAIGAFPELAATIGPTWVQLYVGDLTASVLSDALAAAHRTSAHRTTPDLDSFSWPTIAAATIGVYRCAMGNDASECDMTATDGALS